MRTLFGVLMDLHEKDPKAARERAESYRAALEEIIHATGGDSRASASTLLGDVRSFILRTKGHVL